MRVASIILHDPLNIPGMRVTAMSPIIPGVKGWLGWELHVRGPRVLLCSPRGWKAGSTEPRTGDERVIYDIPRETLTIVWAGRVEDVDKVKEWSPTAAQGKRAKVSDSGKAIEEPAS